MYKKIRIAIKLFFLNYLIRLFGHFGSSRKKNAQAVELAPVANLAILVKKLVNILHHTSFYSFIIKHSCLIRKIIQIIIITQIKYFIS